MNALRRPIALMAALIVSAAAGSPSFATGGAESRLSLDEADIAAPASAAVISDEIAATPAIDPIRQFYDARGGAPFWLDAEGAATDSAKALLLWAGQAAAHALPPARYGVARLATQLSEPAPRSAQLSFELDEALTRLYLTYGRDLSSGVLDPATVSREFDLEIIRPAPAALLSSLAAATDVAAHLDSLRPADPNYDRLVALYAEMKAIQASGGWGPLVDEGPSLQLGDRDRRVAQIRARLTALGDLPAGESAALEPAKLAANAVATDAVASNNPAQTARPADVNRFDAELDAALRRFQERHGLNTDGVAGPATIAALNTSAAERVAQVAVNLERLRWFDIPHEGRAIVINTAAFTMTMLEDGTPRFETRTVVGKAPRFQTPEFNDELEYMVVNPIWNVPYSIASKEILPLLQENPYYLEENNMQLVGSDLPSSLIDWSTVSPRSFPGRLRQMPGPGNALGAVKFLFPNHHAIYMHDTPARKLFARDRRDYSHGCVRLEKPYDFAYLLLSLQPDITDPVARFDQLRGRSGEQWIRLAETIPVFLTYRSVWSAEDGTAQFRADVYRRDRTIADALTRAGVTIGG